MRPILFWGSECWKIEFKWFYTSLNQIPACLLLWWNYNFSIDFFWKKYSFDICDYHQFFYIKRYLIFCLISSSTGNITKADFWMEMIQTFWSFILLNLLQQNMTSTFPSGSTPEKFVPGKKQSFNIIFHYFISMLIFPTWFRQNFNQS